MATKDAKITLPVILTDIDKIDQKFDEATGKVVYHIHNTDGTVTVKTSDPVAMSKTAITIAFDV